MNGGDAHTALASFYDVPQVSLFPLFNPRYALVDDLPPQISIRGPLLPALLRNRTLAAPFFLGDARHITLPLHAFLGKMVVAFLQEEQCRSLEPSSDELVASDSLWPGATILGLVPKVRSPFARHSYLANTGSPAAQDYGQLERPRQALPHQPSNVLRRRRRVVPTRANLWRAAMVHPQLERLQVLPRGARSERRDRL